MYGGILKSKYANVSLIYSGKMYEDIACRCHKYLLFLFLFIKSITNFLWVDTWQIKRFVFVIAAKNKLG